MSKQIPADELVQVLDRMQEQIDNMAKRIATLEVAQMPNPNGTYHGYPVPKINWDISTCPTCGIKLDQVMGYVCSNPRCPTGLGPVTC